MLDIFQFQIFYIVSALPMGTKGIWDSPGLFLDLHRPWQLLPPEQAIKYEAGHNLKVLQAAMSTSCHVATLS